MCFCVVIFFFFFLFTSFLGVVLAFFRQQRHLFHKDIERERCDFSYNTCFIQTCSQRKIKEMWCRRSLQVISTRICPSLDLFLLSRPVCVSSVRCIFSRVYKTSVVVKKEKYAYIASLHWQWRSDRPRHLVLSLNRPPTHHFENSSFEEVGKNSEDAITSGASAENVKTSYTFGRLFLRPINVAQLLALLQGWTREPVHIERTHTTLSLTPELDLPAASSKVPSRRERSGKPTPPASSVSTKVLRLASFLLRGSFTTKSMPQELLQHSQNGTTMVNTDQTYDGLAYNSDDVREIELRLEGAELVFLVNHLENVMSDFFNIEHSHYKSRVHDISSQRNSSEAFRYRSRQLLPSHSRPTTRSMLHPSSSSSKTSSARHTKGLSPARQDAIDMSMTQGRLTSAFDLPQEVRPNATLMEGTQPFTMGFDEHKAEEFDLDSSVFPSNEQSDLSPPQKVGLTRNATIDANANVNTDGVEDQEEELEQQDLEEDLVEEVEEGVVAEIEANENDAEWLVQEEESATDVKLDGVKGEQKLEDPSSSKASSRNGLLQKDQSTGKHLEKKTLLATSVDAHKFGHENTDMTTASAANLRQAKSKERTGDNVEDTTGSDSSTQDEVLEHITALFASSADHPQRSENFAKENAFDRMAIQDYYTSMGQSGASSKPEATFISTSEVTHHPGVDSVHKQEHTFKSGTIATGLPSTANTSTLSSDSTIKQTDRSSVDASASTRAYTGPVRAYPPANSSTVEDASPRKESESSGKAIPERQTKAETTKKRKSPKKNSRKKANKRSKAD